MYKYSSLEGIMVFTLNRSPDIIRRCFCAYESHIVRADAHASLTGFVDDNSLDFYSLCAMTCPLLHSCL